MRTNRQSEMAARRRLRLVSPEAGEPCPRLDWRELGRRVLLEAARLSAASLSRPDRLLRVRPPEGAE